MHYNYNPQKQPILATNKLNIRRCCCCFTETPKFHQDSKIYINVVQRGKKIAIETQLLTP